MQPSICLHYTRLIPDNVIVAGLGDQRPLQLCTLSILASGVVMAKPWHMTVWGDVSGFEEADDGAQMRREADLARAELTRKIQGIRGRQSQVRA